MKLMYIFKRSKNPLGVKIGPSASADDIIALANVLNPNNEEGRLNIIIRMGADKIINNLPKFSLNLKVKV